MSAARMFRTSIDGRYLAEEAHRVRWEKSVRFLEKWRVPAGLHPSGLDLGDRTPMTELAEALFGFTFDSSRVDLDEGSLSGCYGVVTAFEVLEHLFNPLHALLEVKKVMAGSAARLFVSMPLRQPELLRSPEHFHEMSRTAALALFGRSGFRVERSAEFRIRRPLFYLSGFKPLLRFFFERVQVYELSTAEVQRETTAEVQRETTAEVQRETTAEVQRETTAEVQRETTAEVQWESAAAVRGGGV
ncbi:hypothetical protein [Pelodictyon luteolum]|uniref:Class I SAM-dependent methyltransferase n=1 Tax=Chlorobium luteolum (strain DSM 273 / BCRC 81028 / 2530) TaxID=319225 RepID=Q3B6H1_CHLL3|nr:hypothetical protein Plut_0170 [Pelodictyon luteolum DSM 273]